MCAASAMERQELRLHRIVLTYIIHHRMERLEIPPIREPCVRRVRNFFVQEKIFARGADSLFFGLNLKWYCALV